MDYNDNKHQLYKNICKLMTIEIKNFLDFYSL